MKKNRFSLSAYSSVRHHIALAALICALLAVASIATVPSVFAQGQQVSTHPTASNGGGTGAKPSKLAYPVTKTVDQVDNYFGTTVPDPYRWLEDENSPETAKW